MIIKKRHQSVAIGILLLVLLVAAAAFLTANNQLKRVDHVIYDMLLPLQAPDISDQIVVVAIDDNSLMELGRWPWSRSQHARLINKLTAMQARAIGVDILFSEPQQDGTGADARLAESISENGKTVLAVAPTRQNGSQLISELIPIPQLATAAARLAHVDVELDADGLCRSTFLYAGIDDARWPSFALALMMVGGKSPPQAEVSEITTSKGWTRKQKILIPFTSPQQRPKTISYSDVISDRIQASDIKDKYVLIGATASGLGDAISTPGAFSHERMPGIELNAQILNGLLLDKTILELATDYKLLLTISLTAISVLAILLSPLRLSLMIIPLLVAGVLFVTIVLLTSKQLWFEPSATLFSIMLAWPLWSIWQFTLEKRLQQQLLRQLDHQARYHVASGLPNHGMLEDKLRKLPELNSSLSDIYGLMVIHINWPGSASLVLDRPISDAILSAIGNRLREIISEGDYIAHLSGDDFAVLSSAYRDNTLLREAAAQLLTNLQEPLEYGDEKLLLAPQIGVSIWPTDTQDPHALLRKAYTAMFKSRIDETEHLCIYSSSIGHELKIRSELEKALVYALERDEFQVYYQPQINARSGRIVGVEALLRWYNPQLGRVSPDNFIPVAEHVGLIKKIGEWVFETSLRDLQQWNKDNKNRLRLAINVSPLQFMLPELDKGIQRIIGQNQVDPEDIELEITESSLMHDVNTAIKVMHNIKKLGLELAIDDFGTGYSSLSSLRHFPLDRLKIDQSFTREIGKNGDATEITFTILNMAKQLGLKVIAEGVETQQQADFLRNHGCDEFQGYLFGKPVTADEISQLLANMKHK